MQRSIRRLSAPTLLVLVLSACGLGIGFTPIFSPIEFVLSADGSITAETSSPGLVTPLGTFSIHYVEELSDGRSLRAWLQGLGDRVAELLESEEVNLDRGIAVVFIDKSVPPSRGAQGFIVDTAGQDLVDQISSARATRVGGAYVVDVSNRKPGTVARLITEAEAVAEDIDIVPAGSSERSGEPEAKSDQVSRVGDSEDHDETADATEPVEEDEALPTDLPPITPPVFDFPTNTPEGVATEPDQPVVVKTVRPSDTPVPEVDPVTNTPVPVIIPTMPPTATPDCVPGSVAGQIAYPGPNDPGPGYPAPAYPGPQPTRDPPGCVTTTPKPVASYTPPATNTSVPVIVKTVRPTASPPPLASIGPPTPTSVPQVLPCATVLAATACREGEIRPSDLRTRFDEVCLVELEGHPMLRYRIRLENSASFTTQGQAIPRVRSSWNASAVLGGLSCQTAWRLQPGEVVSLVGLVPLASRPPAGASSTLEIRSRTWSCDPKRARFITWEHKLSDCTTLP